MAQYGGFANWGNLLFYPYSVRVDPKNHFFYFNTLMGDYERNHNPGYRVQANKIGENAQYQLSKSPFTEEDTRFTQDLLQMLKIVRQGVTYERANEKRFINNKIQEFKKTFTPEEIKTNEELQEIERLFKSLEVKEGPFDYDKFILLLNYVTQGIENTKALFNYEGKHLEDLQNREEKALQAVTRQLHGLAKARQFAGTDRETKLIEQGHARLLREKADIYLKRTTVITNPSKDQKLTSVEKRLNKYFSGAQTASVKLARFVTDAVGVILKMPATKEKIIQIIESHNMDKAGYAASEKEIRQLLIKGIMSYSKGHMSKILTTDIMKPEDYEAIAQEVINNYEQVMNIQAVGLFENFGQFGHELDFFDQTKQLKDGTESAKGLYDAVLALKKQINKREKLTAEQSEVSRKLSLKTHNSQFNQELSLVRQLEQAMEKASKKSKYTQTLNTTIKINKETVDLIIRIENDGQKTKMIVSNFNALKTMSVFNYFQSRFGSAKKNGANIEIELSSLITGIKTRMSNQIKAVLRECINQAKDQKAKDKLIRKLQTGLENIRVSVGGPTYEEVIGIFQRQSNSLGKDIWTGRLNLKNDAVSIEVEAPEESFILDLSDITEGLINPNIWNARISTIYKEYGDKFAETIYEKMKDTSKQKQYTDYEKQRKDFFEASRTMQEYIDLVDKELTNAMEVIENNEIDQKKKEKALEELNKKKRAYIKNIKESLYVSSTMKTLNTYDNRIGFVGGSLGETITDQIESIADMFEGAGILLTKEDIDWLTFAAINSSPLSVVGEKNKGLIEDYLGSLAIFAMFNEGQAELEILRAQLGKRKQPTSPKILHLYKMNGLYYPGSFVLSQIVDSLEQMLQLTEEVNKERRNSVILTSDVKFTDLPNYKLKDWNKLNTHPWETMSFTAEHKTHLRVVFLGGLLDIVNNIRKAFNNTEVPT